MIRVAISGIDGVGKTQQINLLRYDNGNQLYFTRRLEEYSSRWPDLAPSDSFAWWFNDISLEELISIIAESLNNRYQDVVSGKITVHDRSTRMFMAVCAAHAMTRRECSAENAVAHICKDLLPQLNYKPEDEILLLPDPRYFTSIRPLLNLVEVRGSSFTELQNDTYRVFQKYLRCQVEHYCSGDIVSALNVDCCILHTQNHLREILGDLLKISLPPLCPNLETILAFGGLSECGKSGFASACESEGYYRLKLKYFEDVVRGRGEEANARHMGQEILNFLRCHAHLDKVTVESLHSPALPAYLKLLFGDCLKIIFLDVAEELRIDRTMLETGLSKNVITEQIRKKDELKRSRGAHLVHDIADIVFQNDIEDLSVNASRLLTII